MVQSKTKEQLKADRELVRQGNLTKQVKTTLIPKSNFRKFAIGTGEDGITDPIIDPLTGKPVTAGADETALFNTKKIVRYQSGVTHATAGDGFYLYSKNVGDAGFDVKRDREFVKNSEMHVVQRTPEWKDYMKTQKFGFGSSGVGGNYVVPPSTTLAQNEITKAKADQIAETNPYSNMTMIAGSLLNASMPLFAGAGVGNPDIDIKALGDSNAGGPVEVEGKEVVETPNGEIGEVKGPSHEQGGVDAHLPQGTKIYSKRVEKFGESMAERKMARERRTTNLEKLLSENKDDIAIKNTHSRSIQALEREEAEDLKTQEMYGMMAAIQEYAYGTNKDGTPKYGIGTNMFGVQNDPATKPFDSFINNWGEDISSLPKSTTASVADEPVTKQAGDSLLTDLHLGDAVGMVGNAISTFGPMKNTLQARATDTPNVNAFANYGKDALDTNLKAMEYAASNKNSILQRIDSQTNGVKRSGRNGARGINQIRGNDLAADEQSNAASLSANDSFMNTMNQLFGYQSQLQNQKDQAFMSGEAGRDLADRQDKDNFYTQKGKDISTQGTGVQHIGKDLNAMDQNKMMMNIQGNLSKWGLSWDKDGNIIQKTKTT